MVAQNSGYKDAAVARNTFARIKRRTQERGKSTSPNVTLKKPGGVRPTKRTPKASKRTTMGSSKGSGSLPLADTSRTVKAEAMVKSEGTFSYSGSDSMLGVGGNVEVWG